MTYVEDNLLSNEVINYEWKVHSFYIFLMWIWVFLGFLFIIPFFSWWHEFNLILWWWIMLWFIYKILYILTTEIVVTNKRVLYKTWFISRNVFELQLSKVESAVLNQTIFERIIWAWTLVVSWTWWHNKPIVNLAKPIEMRTIIYTKIEND